jgi:hypothetical protein
VANVNFVSVVVFEKKRFQITDFSQNAKRVNCFK